MSEMFTPDLGTTGSGTFAWDSLDAQALAQCQPAVESYLERGSYRTDAERAAVRNAVLYGLRVGYRLGCADALKTCTELTTAVNDRGLLDRLTHIETLTARVTQLMQSASAQRESWRQLRRV